MTSCQSLKTIEEPKSYQPLSQSLDYLTIKSQLTIFDKVNRKKSRVTSQLLLKGPQTIRADFFGPFNRPLIQILSNNAGVLIIDHSKKEVTQGPPDYLIQVLNIQFPISEISQILLSSKSTSWPCHNKNEILICQKANLTFKKYTDYKFTLDHPDFEITSIPTIVEKNQAIELNRFNLAAPTNYKTLN